MEISPVKSGDHIKCSTFKILKIVHEEDRSKFFYLLVIDIEKNKIRWVSIRNGEINIEFIWKFWGENSKIDQYDLLLYCIDNELELVWESVSGAGFLPCPSTYLKLKDEDIEGYRENSLNKNYYVTVDEIENYFSYKKNVDGELSLY